MVGSTFSSGAAKWGALVCLALLASLGLYAFYPARIGARSTVPDRPREPEVHYVTPRQLTDSSALAATTVPALAATTDRDQLFTWPHPGDRRPLVLFFIKNGCPCSVEMEPFFQRVARTYADVVHFAGVIDGDVRSARSYAEANATPYPILADPQRQIIHRFRAENGAYVALVTPSGFAEGTSPPGGSPAKAGAPGEPTIDCLWPGCSAEMLNQMGRRIAAGAGIAERPLDVCGAPGAPVTGCPFAP
jgi:peroxiredoxin